MNIIEALRQVRKGKQVRSKMINRTLFAKGLRIFSLDSNNKLLADFDNFSFIKQLKLLLCETDKLYIYEILANDWEVVE